MVKSNLKLPKNSFMKYWYINPKICDNLIKTFKKIPSNLKFKGEHYNTKTGKLGVNVEIKESLDYSFVINKGIEPFYSYELQLQKCLEDYIKTYPAVGHLPRYNIEDNKINIQYYKPNQGFKTWHCERGDYNSLKRFLVFFTYLNDVPDGGTFFKYFNIKIPAKKGLTIIFPSDWTHTHKGQISKTKEKYITTGWYSLV
jgi:hypothetical protein|tara:strand:+ start:816 stop:1412 length:597 start_codon:yes stop_codon:yes gene_type:complete